MKTWEISEMACDDRSFCGSEAMPAPRIDAGLARGPFTPLAKRIAANHVRSRYGKRDDETFLGAIFTRTGKTFMKNDKLTKFALVVGLMLGLAPVSAGDVLAGQRDTSRAGLATMAAYLPQAEAASDRAAQFIESLTGHAMIMLQQENISDEGRKDVFRELLSAGFDMDLIGRVALGRNNWKNATSEQREEYIGLFGNYLVEAYGSNISSSLAKRLSVRKSVPLDDKDTLVHTTLSSGGQAYYQIAWRVRGSGEDMRVIDVIIQGVSMLVTHRSEFTAVVARDGIEGLLGHLRGNDAAM